jgi:hypothetical protein
MFLKTNILTRVWKIQLISIFMHEDYIQENNKNLKKKCSITDGAA